MTAMDRRMERHGQELTVLPSDAGLLSKRQRLLLGGRQKLVGAAKVAIVEWLSRRTRGVD